MLLLGRFPVDGVFWIVKYPKLGNRGRSRSGKMKAFVKKIPILGKRIQRIYRWLNPSKRFPGSKHYWIERYGAGGNSGDGSYSKLAEFKARILNQFVGEQQISTVIEFGCGDGNQLRYAEYPKYTGYDISPDAIKLCREIFGDDPDKDFHLVGDYTGETAELVLSLDVIFHLVEDDVFDTYMRTLFEASTKWVVIYSSNYDDRRKGKSRHVRHRMFTDWIEQNRPDWKLIRHIPNEYEFKGDTSTGSFSDFYIFRRPEE